MTVFVPVIRYRREVRYAWVDADAADEVRRCSWFVAGGYALSSRLGLMHRFLLGLTPGVGIVHHKNEDPLDNRVANLQVFDTAIGHLRAPHPRRDAACRGRRITEPFERELALADAGLCARVPV